MRKFTIDQFINNYTASEMKKISETTKLINYYKENAEDRIMFEILDATLRGKNTIIKYFDENKKSIYDKLETVGYKLTYSNHRFYTIVVISW